MVGLLVSLCNQAFEECDENGDGQLSFDEFKQWYSTQN